MTIFHLEITTHGEPRQFGDTSSAERAVLIGLLSQCAQVVGAGRPLGSAAEPVPLILAGQTIGRFWAGGDSHTAQGRR